MRAIKLVKTLGVGSFEGMQAAVGSQLFASGGGFGNSSSPQRQTQAFQHTKASSTPESGDRPQPQPPIPDPFDLEFDRFNGGLMADAEEATATPTPRQPFDPLTQPVDLEFELDRDDPEAVDMDQLYESPNEEDEEKMSVNLDDEYDLIRDHVMGMVEPDSSEQEKILGSRTGGTNARHSIFEAVKEAASGGTPVPPGQGTA